MKNTLTTTIILFLALISSCNTAPKNNVSQKKESNTAPEKTNITCSDKGGNMESGFEKECLYEGYTLIGAYRQYRENNKNGNGAYLDQAFPEGNVQLKKDETEISYTFKSDKQLEVLIQMPGGETSITFTEAGGSTKVVELSSPD